VETFKSFETQLYHLNDLCFDDIAVELFQLQAIHNPVYRHYLESLRVNPKSVNTLTGIPFLPISFFKTHLIQTHHWKPEAEFVSSGTTEKTASRHLIRDMSFYLNHARRCFESFFGDIKHYHFLALLPSYLERKNSSLVAMIDHFIRESQSTYSGFYLTNYDKLLRDIEALRGDSRKVILWGVSFALLDLAEFEPDLSHCMVFETGGMKGRRREVTRAELYETLKRSFHVGEIFSEYGMTELLSQCYSMGSGIFKPPASVRILIRETTDPFHVGTESVGGINVVDLANFHSVAFIETEDMGKIAGESGFEVMGRLDNSEVRGCNLLVQ
jgi:hypothetical protein